MAWNAASFGDFFNSNRAQRLTPAQTVLNLSRATNYPFFMLLKGQDEFNMCKGGTSIIETVKVTDTGTFGSYTPGEFAAVNIASTTATLAYQWRFKRSHVGWTDMDVMMQTAGGSFVEVKNFKKIKEKERVTEHVKGLDSLCFARPNYTSMEAAPGGTGAAAEVYSLPAWISEDTTRYLPPSTAWGTNSLGGLDPTTVSVWRNAVTNYDHTDPSNPLTGIIASFDAMELKLKFNPVPGAEAEIESTRADDLVIYTNSNGVLLTKSLYRNAQDRWDNQKDASWNGTVFDGIPFVHAPQLDSALLEQSTGSSAAYTGTAYTAGKPRFYWVNKTTLRPVFALSKDPLTAEPPMRISGNQPDTQVVWTVSTLNIACNARNRNGICAPTTPG